MGPSPCVDRQFAHLGFKNPGIADAGSGIRLQPHMCEFKKEAGNRVDGDLLAPVDATRGLVEQNCSDSGSVTGVQQSESPERCTTEKHQFVD